MTARPINQKPFSKALVRNLLNQIPYRTFKPMLLSVPRFRPWRGLPASILLLTLLGPIATPICAATVAVNIAPATTRLKTGAFNSSNNAGPVSANTATTWTGKEEGNGGFVTNPGVYTASSSASPYPVPATTLNNSATSTSATVTAGDSDIAVTVSPSTATITVGATLELTATVTGTTTTSVSWSATGGSFSGAIYTAPAEPGNYTITAVSTADPTRHGNATVVVVAMPLDTAISETTTGGADTAPIRVDHSILHPLPAMVLASGAHSPSLQVAIGLGETVLDVSGVWVDTTYKRPMTLFQTGTTVWGTYDYSSSYQYRVDGTLNGYVLTGTMNQTNGSERYSFTFTFAPDGKSWSGGLSSWLTTWAANKQDVVIVQMSPSAPRIVKAGDQVAYTAVVAGSGNKGIAWTATTGTIDSNGVYLVPSGVDDTAQTITATALANGTSKASAQVTVTPSGILDISGVWIDTSRNRPMTLFQAGTTVWGTYDYSSSYQYRIDGTLNGYVLTGTMNQTNGSERYTFTFTFSPDEKSWSGGLSSWLTTWAANRQNGVVIQINPTTPRIVKPGDQVTYTAVVAGSRNKGITWSATTGMIDSNGVYTVPSGVDDTVQTITATALADGTRKASAQVTVTPGGTLDVSGVWVDTTSNRPMTLFQTGTTVWGTYDYSSSYQYRIDGTLNGYVLTGTMNQTNGSERYTFTFTFSPDEKSWSGGLSSWRTTWAANKQNGIVVQINPTIVKIVKPGDQITYTAAVAGSRNKGITWSATTGTIDSNGVYTVPSGVDDTVQTITATALADGTRKASAQVTVTPGGVLDVSGVWIETRNNLPMTLFQAGTTVWGTYFSSGCQYQIDGTLSGYVLTGTMNQTNGSERYTFTFTFSPDEKSWSGGLSSWLTTWAANKQNGVVVQINPTTVKIVKPGDQITYTAAVAGSRNKGIVWSATTGTIDSNGVYTVPSGVDDTVQTITATALADGTTKASAQVTVTPGGVLDVSGVWMETRNNLPMTLFQTGTTVWGTYSSSGCQYRIDGTLNGYVLTGTMNQTNGSERYTFTFTFSPDEKSWSGGLSSWLTTWAANKQSGVVVQINPTTVKIVKAGDMVPFTAQVGGTRNKGIVWSASAGTVDSSGNYLVPTGYIDTLQVITATALGDTSAKDSSQVNITSDRILNIEGVFFNGTTPVMTFAQSGTNITGDWADSQQSQVNLTLNGYDATGTWSSGSSPTAPGGMLQLTFSIDRKSFQGKYGLGASAPAYGVSGTIVDGRVGVVTRPRPLTIRKGLQAQFQAQVVGTKNKNLFWALLEPLGGTVSNLGLYTAPGTWGTYNLKVVSSADVSQNFTVPIHVNPPVVVSPASVSVSPLGTQAFTAQLTGFVNNQSGVIWSVVEPNGGTVDSTGTYTAPGFAGIYTVQAKSIEDDAQLGTSTITVPFSITVTPGRVNLVSGQTNVFTATVSGHPNKAVDWILPDAGSGSIAQDGTYTAPSILQTSVNTPYQSVRLIARSQGDPTQAGLALITVYKSIYLNSEYESLSPGGTKNFTVSGASLDDRGAVWTATGGTLSSHSGYQTYTAPSTPGAYLVKATSVMDPTKSATALVLVNVSAPVSISPPSVTLRAGATYKFTASINGLVSGAVTWSANGGIIAQDGTFSLPNQSGIYTITATSVADPTQVATSNVTVPLEVVVAPTAVSLRGGFSQQYTANVSGNSNQSVTWKLSDTTHGSINAAGIFTPALGLPQYTSGYVFASANVDPTRTGSAYYTINRPIDVSPASTTVALGVTQIFNATLTGLSGGVSWSTTGGPLSLQTGNSVTWTAPTTAGIYTVTATSLLDTSLKSVAVVVVPIQFQIQPQRSVLNLGISQQYIARVMGTSDKNVIWNVAEQDGGVITSKGVYSSGDKAGFFHINAIPMADPSKSSQAIVQVFAGLQVDPGYVKVKPNGRLNFKAIIASAVSHDVVWSIQETSGGTISSTGDYTAPSQPGTYHVVATRALDVTSFGVATVVVSDTASIQVTISSNTSEATRLGSIQFSARVDGTNDQGVTWSATLGSVSATGLFTAPNTLGPVTITATSNADPTKKDSTVVVVKALEGIDRAYTYDDNGNLSSDGARTFEWDAENRLVSVTIIATGHRSEFGYDGLGRRVEIIEKDPDATQTLQITSDKKYLWDGVEIAEERDSTGGNVTKRFFGQGFVDTDGTILFYTRDHLGSIRELTDSTQAVRARYDYDPYGRMTKISGDKDSLYGYTGMHWHQASGLNLTYYRAYDPNLGRWISRDPIGEAGGTNVYAYVKNKPIIMLDPLGLDGIFVWFPQGGQAGHASAEIGGTYSSLWPEGGGLQAAHGVGPGKWHTYADDISSDGEGRVPDLYIPISDPIFPDPANLPIPNSPPPPWGPSENDCADDVANRIKKKYPNFNKNHKRKKRDFWEWIEPGVNGPIYWPTDLIQDINDWMRNDNIHYF